MSIERIIILPIISLSAPSGIKALYGCLEISITALPFNDFLVKYNYIKLYFIGQLMVQLKKTGTRNITRASLLIQLLESESRFK